MELVQLSDLSSKGDLSMPSVYMRVRATHDHLLVSICDENLLGRTLVEGDLTFKVSEEFYGGELVDMKKCFVQLKDATIANMIGQTTVKAAINAGLVHESAVIYIEGHPHAQWVRM